MKRDRLRRATAAAAAVVGVLALPAAAHSAPAQESIVEDELHMLESGPEARVRALDDARALGADTIRANVLWGRLAPASGDRQMPAGFDGANPAAYPPGTWDALTELVAGAEARGLSVILTVTGAGPAWASRCRGSIAKLRTCRPRPRLFGDFVRAVGAQFPQVKRWSIWNEPNQPGWLSPQYARVRGVTVPVAAGLYRSLARAAIAALQATGHGADQILLGETAPVGRTTGPLARRPVAPEFFLRELFCIDGQGRRLRGRTARQRGCTPYPRFAVSGYAHHPYGRSAASAPGGPVSPGEIGILTSGRLKRVLDQAARAGRIPRRLPIFYTEHGYQTRPPEPVGVSLARQAAYINQSDWIAFRDSRIRSVAQYKLVDDPDLAGFQTGLRFLSGRAKPAYAAYRLPIWVTRRGSRLTIYGQVRPADGVAGPVAIQRQARRGRPFRTIRTVNVRSLRGHFTTRVPARPGVYRLNWQGMVSR
ncbi:MAG TPA: hypothetical protein VN213_12435, partial [Solirubrobacteraceae bacterium]|nr:hypothetical protein [Solirubrobacteraceae bacterium]